LRIHYEIGRIFCGANLETPQKTGFYVEHLETHRGFQMFPVSFARNPATGQKDTASIPCAVSCLEQVPSRGNSTLSLAMSTS
jgi:hypothetical protein